jgi:hypothetical protein
MDFIHKQQTKVHELLYGISYIIYNYLKKLKYAFHDLCWGTGYQELLGQC